MKSSPHDTIQFFREWLAVDKPEFRILAMLADVGDFEGNLSDMCRYFSLSVQTSNRNKLKDSIEKLQANGFITYQKNGNTYTIKVLPQNNCLDIPRRWTEPIMSHDYSTESVSWEAVLKVFIWIWDNKIPVVTNADIVHDTGLSESTVVSAKNILINEHKSICYELVKNKFSMNGTETWRNVGQMLFGKAVWSE